LSSSSIIISHPSSCKAKNGAHIKVIILQIIEEKDRQIDKHIRFAIPLVQVLMQEVLKLDYSSRVKTQQKEGR
jgi:hypothetical protein